MAFNLTLNSYEFDTATETGKTFETTVTPLLTSYLTPGSYTFDIYRYDVGGNEVTIYTGTYTVFSQQRRMIIPWYVSATDLTPIIANVYDGTVYFRVTFGDETALTTANVYNSSRIDPSFTVNITYNDALTVGGITYGIQTKTTAMVTFSATAGTFPIDGYGARFSSRPINSQGIGTVTVSPPAGYGETPLYYGVRAGGKWFYNQYTVDVLPYETPGIVKASSENVILCQRCTQNDVAYSPTGMYLGIKCKKSFSPLAVGGTAQNTAQLEARIATVGGSYGAWSVVSAYSDTDSVTYISSSPTFSDLASAYTVQLRITDAVESVIVEYQIGTANIPLHLSAGGRSVGIGQLASAQNDRVDFGWPVHLNNGIGEKIVYSGESKATYSTITASEGDFTAIENFRLFAVNDDTLGMRKHTSANGFDVCATNGSVAIFIYNKQANTISVGRQTAITSITAII